MKLKGVSVSSPVLMKNNEYLYDLEAPEGLRHMVLFTYADGEYSEEEDKVNYSVKRLLECIS